MNRQTTSSGESATSRTARQRSPWVYEGSDGTLVLYNGVTRAPRIAKLAPGVLIRIEIIGRLPKAFATQPTIGDLLP